MRLLKMRLYDITNFLNSRGSSFCAFARLLRALLAMSRGQVTVEIFTAGDGINYPKKGQTVTIHYTGYVRQRHSSTPLFHV